MNNNESVIIDSSSIKPLIGKNESQIILQRHCNYDKTNGGLNPESVEYQKLVVTRFINELKHNLTLDELKKTYFLFDSSNTISSKDFKRCVETANIAMNIIKHFFQENSVPLNHIINLNEKLNYSNNVHENKNLTEPKMFTDSTGYLEYLKEKHGGINKDFWIDFESDLSKEKRQELNSEGPDEIVNRGEKYINIIQKYANYFHSKFPDSRLIVWASTHYDLISPLVKQKILNYDKSDIVNVDYCGGISLLIDEFNNITVNLNSINYPLDSQYNKQHHRHF